MDAFAERQVLGALTPAAVEVCLHAADQVMAERAELEQRLPVASETRGMPRGSRTGRTYAESFLRRVRRKYGDPVKALLLSGGSDACLRPMTHTSAKRLVPVANKRVLFYGLGATAGAAITQPEPFVYIATGEVHGSIDSGSRPDTDPPHPNSPYAASKASSDLIALAHHRTHGLDVRAILCSNNATGPTLD